MLRRDLAVMAIGLGLAAMLGTATASAESDDRPATEAEKAQITAKLEGLGYREIRDIEVDDGIFEADAISPAGHDVDLQLELGTFEIVGESRE